MQAVLQDPSGWGDATVPLSSAAKLNKRGKPFPGDTDISLEHQPAYENPAAQTFTVNAITALSKLRYEQKRQG
jgi:hypothetical protein